MNKISVVILNYSRPAYIKKDIIPALQKIDLIDELVISHGKEKVFFEIDSTSDLKITNLKHWGDYNKEYGLTLRFLSALQAKNKKIIIMDDDIIPYSTTVDFLNEKIEEDENNIYGLYGRMLDKEENYSVTNYFGNVHIVLTRCLITTKNMCQYFIDNYKKYENNLVKNSKPFWNGEDILFSFMSIERNSKLPKAYDLKHTNRVLNYINFKESISMGNNSHLEYRKELCKEFLTGMKIRDKFTIKNPSKNWRYQLSYFFNNSVLPVFFYLFVILVFIIDVYYYVGRI